MFPCFLLLAQGLFAPGIYLSWGVYLLFLIRRLSSAAFLADGWVTI